MGESDVRGGVDILLRNKIPHYILPESMCKSFATVYEFSQSQNHITSEEPKEIKHDTATAAKIINDCLGAGRRNLLEDQATQVLNCFGIPVIKNQLAATEEEAVKAAAVIGYPVAMKIMSEQIIHKSDTGGVVLNVKSDTEAKTAFRTISENVKKNMPEAVINGILVSEMIDEGQEVILGVKRDPAFGPVVMFGLGGIYVEIFRDVVIKVAPVNEKTAREMIAGIKASTLLTGARGATPKDIDSIADAIVRLSQLAVALPAIRELDINPLIVLDQGKGCRVADAKIIL